MAAAQGDYPNQMVRIVVPFSAGSITDGLARILADKLAIVWKQQVIVENRAGLPGTTGVAKSPPDGYTLMLTSNGHTIAGVINKNLQFDPVKDFAGVSQVAAVPMVMIVPPDFPAKSLKEFLQMAKDKPGRSTSPRPASPRRRSSRPKSCARTPASTWCMCPTRARPEAVTAVVRGDAQMYFAPIPAAQELGATGKVQGAGDQFGQARAAAARHPDGRRVRPARLQIRFLVRRDGARPARRSRSSTRSAKDIALVLAMPDVKEKLDVQGSIPAPNTPEQFDAIIKSDTERYGKIMRDAGVGTN